MKYDELVGFEKKALHSKRTSLSHFQHEVHDGPWCPDYDSILFNHRASIWDVDGYGWDFSQPSVIYGYIWLPSWQVCEILEPLASLECLESSFVAPEISEMVPKTSRLRIMTWNACAISFPLQIHPLKFLLGLFLGRWWHDACYDAPMEINNGSAQLRYARQADYIRHAGADLAFQNLLHQNLFEGVTPRWWWFATKMVPSQPPSYTNRPEERGWDYCKNPGSEKKHTKTKHHKTITGPHNGFISEYMILYIILILSYTYHTPSLRKSFKMFQVRFCFQKSWALLCWTRWCSTCQRNSIALIWDAIQEYHPWFFGHVFSSAWELYKVCSFRSWFRGAGCDGFVAISFGPGYW